MVSTDCWADQIFSAVTIGKYIYKKTKLLPLASSVFQQLRVKRQKAMGRGENWTLSISRRLLQLSIYTWVHFSFFIAFYRMFWKLCLHSTTLTVSAERCPCVFESHLYKYMSCCFCACVQFLCVLLCSDPLFSPGESRAANEPMTQAFLLRAETPWHDSIINKLTNTPGQANT